MWYATALCRRSFGHTKKHTLPGIGEVKWPPACSGMLGISKERNVSTMSHKVYITNKQKAVKVPSACASSSGVRAMPCWNMSTLRGPAEISVTFVDDEEIARLNEQYRNKPQPTDVLSFPLGENGKYDVNQETGAAMLGDIVISMQRAMEQASLYGHSLQREVAYLTVHSMFHLLGYDHEAGGLEAVRMREKEEATLIQLGLPRTVSYSVDQI